MQGAILHKPLYFDRVLQQKPRDYETYYLSSLCYLNKADSIKTLMLLDSASKYGKYQKYMHEEFLAAATMLDSTNHMIKAYSRLITYYSYDKKYRIERGKLYLSLGLHEEAVIDFKHYVKHNRKDGDAHYYYGQSLMKTGYEKEGRRHLEKAKKLFFNTLANFVQTDVSRETS